jgi:hypothetical protein
MKGQSGLLPLPLHHTTSLLRPQLLHHLLLMWKEGGGGSGYTCTNSSHCGTTAGLHRPAATQTLASVGWQGRHAAGLHPTLRPKNEGTKG